MRVRILCLVVLGLVATPLAGWAKCAELDPYGGCLNEATVSFGADPSPILDPTAVVSNSTDTTLAATVRATENRDGSVVSESLVDAFLHWLIGLMPSV